MAQTWHDLLFAHWPVETSQLRACIPQSLEIDTFNAQAWIAVVPFRMTGIRLRGTPAVPWLSAFPELNVRTYVTYEGKPGVWFFSLDADNPVAVAIARAWFHLPYFRARMSCSQSGEWLEYASQRKHSAAPAAMLRARYRAIGPVLPPRPGTLEHFLTERYCLYSVDGAGRLIRAEIHHPPWPLQLAEAEFADNTMTQPLGIALNLAAPLLHFSKRQEVRVWPPRQLFAEANDSSTS
ncbi:MAG TPA: DUF2071 domain-containing protein [Candidatus Angelobacter sp.]|nr:DUF2071 domain-containing protein [Candidatus Angelobacter sp.]